MLVPSIPDIPRADVVTLSTNNMSRVCLSLFPVHSNARPAGADQT